MDPYDRPQENNDVSAVWMITFSDLVLLLLTFFVLLFSMTEVKSAKWQAVVETLNASLNPEKDGKKLVPTEDLNVMRITTQERADLDYLSTILAEKMSDVPALAQSALHRLDDRVVISLFSEALFEHSRVELTDEAARATFALGELLQHVGGGIEVHGHVAPDEGAAGPFASPWELSLARALTIATALGEAGVDQEIRTLGLGDSRARHIDPELPAQTRRRLAARVDVVIRDGTGEGGRDAR